MSKKDDSPAISLFSFQDIITSITGIMFLVVLLLMLLIFESVPSDKPVRSEQEEKERAAISAEIARIQMQLKELEKQQKELSARIKELQKMSPAMIELKKRTLEQELKKLEKENFQLQTKIDRLEQQKHTDTTVIKDMKKKREQLTAANHAQKQKNEKLKRSIAQTEEEIRQLKKLVRFSVDQSSKKNFLLAEGGPDGFRVRDVANNKEYDLRRKGATDDQKVLVLLEWAKKRDRLGESFSIILGPSTLKYEFDVINNLEKMGFDCGLELYPDDKSSIFSDTDGQVQP